MSDDEQAKARLRRRIEMFWGDRERPQRGPRPSLTLKQIADEAITIADAEGLAAVTMQRLAKQLGFSTMALYRYVASKDDLVALMVDEIAADVATIHLVDGSWRERLSAWAHAVLDMYHEHPWSPTASIDSPPQGPNQLKLLESVLLATEDAQIPKEARTEIALLLSNYVRGFAQVSVGMTAAERELEDQVEASRELYVEHLRNVSERQFPSLRRSLDAGLFSEDETGLIDSFEFGLQRILDGIEHYINSGKH
jgi:AcrR family transcriptional regulator